jgi:hypothetical protein
MKPDMAGRQRQIGLEATVGFQSGCPVAGLKAALRLRKTFVFGRFLLKFKYLQSQQCLNVACAASSG